MSDKKAPAVTVLGDTRDVEINRLQRSMHHLLVASQMAAATGAQQRQELALANAKLAKQAQKIHALEVQQRDTWAAAIVMAANTVGYGATTLADKPTAEALATVAKSITAFMSESSESIAEAVAAFQGKAQ